jgi:hypothetical protein
MVMGALRRQWERDMALFRGDAARPGQRLGVVIGLVITFAVICVTVWSIVAGQNA